MNLVLRIAGMALLFTSFSQPVFSQKIDVGYDKAADFSQFHTYTWREPKNTPARPLLFASIVMTVDSVLKSKGLDRVDKDGDLSLAPAGGMEFGFNVAADTPILSTFSGPIPTMDATMWTGASGAALTAPAVPEGTLVLTFVDQKVNKVVWSGTVSDRLDLENKTKSLDRINKGIIKLLNRYPPGKK